jgi:uncharacterized protein (DUF952 family)
LPSGSPGGTEVTDDRLEPGEHIFHLAAPADWAAAQSSGKYRISTRGRTLDEEGFIHASRAGQVEGVRAAFYADLTDLVLLDIDPERLTSPLHLEVPPGADQAFPHIYGPLDVDAVVGVRNVTGPGT